MAGATGGYMGRLLGHIGRFRAELGQFGGFLGCFGGYLFWVIDPRFLLVALGWSAGYGMNCPLCGGKATHKSKFRKVEEYRGHKGL